MLTESFNLRAIENNFQKNQESNTDKLTEWLKPGENEEKQKVLYLINTRLWINELSEKYNQKITISTIPDAEWKDKFEQYDIFWFMGIYQPSEAGLVNAKKYSDQYRYALPNINSETDIVASPFAIPDYSPNPLIAKDWNEWDKMVDKLHLNNKKVYLDFVGNHTAIDHPWAKSHPEYFIQGDEYQYKNNPNFYIEVENDKGKKYLAHGKDPNFPEWSDTLQLNYAQPEVQKIMEEQLLILADHSDGLRCDMAMLLNSSTFVRTWGWCLNDDQKNYLKQNEFWKKVIPKVKEKAKNNGKENFEFMAEAYWEKEELGESFDYIYCDEFYKNICKTAHGESSDIIKNQIYFLADLPKTRRHYKDVIYIENHDEERAIKSMGRDFSKAAVVVASLIPNSMLMINQGQEDGKMIRPPMQINHFPKENQDLDLKDYYQNIIDLKKTRLFKEGNWQIVDANSTKIIAQKVTSPDNKIAAIIYTNLSPDKSYGRLNDVKNGHAANVYNMNDRRKIVSDQLRDGGMFIALDSYESQIVFFEPEN